MKGIVNFLFETGMLKKTPRTGYQFLGSGKESVAEHSFRTAVIGYILSLEEKVDSQKTTLMCLFHDLHEARTGDHNYVNKKYVQINEDKAVEDLTKNIPFGQEIMELTREFNNGQTIESQIARDADQIDLILELKEQQDLGNRYATEWLYYAEKRLITKSAKKLTREILETDSTDWWFKKKDELWVNGPLNNQDEDHKF